jgi:asparagine synthase (glutamine-hydrolysing)
MGIAPLYVAREPGRLWFSSSAFALASLMKRRRAMDRRRAAAFLVTGMRDFDGGTLFDGVEAFPPGAFLRLPAGRARMVDPCPTSFWVLPDPAEVHDRSLDEAAERLRELLDSAVRMRMRGDLSVAFQLSGGLDSAAVVALACSGAPREVAAYTVSVPEADEAPLAATMSRLHPVRRTVLRGGEGSLVEELGSFTRLMEEPVQAPGAWANHDLCRRMQMDGFGVVVSGSGGDEVLAGYEGDFWPGARLALRRRGRWLQVLEYDLVLRYGTTGRMRSSLRGWTRWVRRIPHRLAARLDPNDRPPRADSISEEGSGHEGAALLARYARLDYVNRRRYHFRRANLPYYLASNDHATLGIPVEHRQPFLDHRVVELGLSLPPEHLFRRGWTKYVLRHAMRGLIPEEILWRREKTGFPFPLRRFLLTHAAELAPIAGRWQGWGTADATVSFRTMVCSDPSRAWRNVAMGSWMEIL